MQTLLRLPLKDFIAAIIRVFISTSRLAICKVNGLVLALVSNYFGDDEGGEGDVSAS